MCEPIPIYSTLERVTTNSKFLKHSQNELWGRSVHQCQENQHGGYSDQWRSFDRIPVVHISHSYD